MLLALLQYFVDTAHAVTLQGAGSTNPAVAQMWNKICTVLPFCSVGMDAPRLFACKIARFIFGSISGVAIAVIIYSAIKMITAQGDESAISESKKIIFYASGGVILAMISFAVVPFISIVIASAFGNASTPVVPLQCM
jgi:membrane protein YqaA with SNARE-associated domain